MSSYSILNFVSQAELDRAIANSAAVRLGLIEKAKEVQEFWVSYWNSIDHPYARQHTLKSGYVERPGDYAKNVRIYYMRTAGGFMKARVWSRDYKSHWIEYGAKHMPEFHPRQSTLENFGGGGDIGSVYAD